jgi:hypothetical protein
MSTEYTPPPPDHGKLPGKRIALVAGGWLLLVVLSVLATRFWQGRSRPSSRAEPPSAMGRAEISIVNQRPFALEDQAPKLRGAQQSRLDGYGWVDRDAGVIHVPVERAMDAVLAEEGARP